MAQKILNFIRKDTTCEGESYLMVLLLRNLSMIMMGYYLCMGTFMLATKNKIPMGMFYGLFVLCIVFFACSYKYPVRRLMDVLIFGITVAAFVSTVQSGWNMGFEVFYVTCVVFMYNNTAFDIHKKRLFGVVGLTLMAVTFYCSILVNPRQDVWDASLVTYAIFINMFFFMHSVIVIGMTRVISGEDSENLLLEQSELLVREADTDALTGLQNRRGLDKALKDLERRYIQNQEIFSIAIGDIDLFKKVNDTYGHDAGDYVLVELSKLMQNHVQFEGFVGRWGGEEFLLVFTRANGDQAQLILEQLRKAIQAMELNFKGEEIHITMTFGLEEYCQDLGLEATVKNADKKLYMGKQQGRNRVVY